MGQLALVRGCLLALCLEGLLHSREHGVAVQGLVNDLLDELRGRSCTMHERGCLQERVPLGAQPKVGLGVAAGHLA